MASTRGCAAKASAGTARATAAEARNARMKARSTLVKILPACSPFPCGRGSRLLPSKSGRSMLRSLFVAAVLAAVLPGSALGAGLGQQRDPQPQASTRLLQTRSFELVGLHWRG